jgi:hypothetical protein
VSERMRRGGRLQVVVRQRRECLRQGRRELLDGDFRPLGGLKG